MIRYFLIIIIIISTTFSVEDVLAKKKKKGHQLSLTNTEIVDFGDLDAGSGGTIKSNGITTGDIYSFGGMQNGKWQITGKKNEEINVFLINSFPYLTSGGNSASTSFEIIGSSPYVIGGNSKLTINIIGTLTVTNGQASGYYIGDYEIEVEYANITCGSGSSSHSHSGSGGSDDDDDDDGSVCG